MDQSNRETRDRRNTYVKKWRQTTARQKRVNYFIEEYVREKFHSVHAEAMVFYRTLDDLYPQKIDLRKTAEFRRWKKAIANANNCETPPDGQNQTSHEQQQPGDTNQMPQPSSPQTSETPPEISTPPPPEIGAEVTIEMPPIELPSGPENIDQSIMEILEELRNDPDLEGIFNDLPSHVDEGFEDDIW